MKKFLVAVLIAAIALVPALAQDNTPDAGSFGITANVSNSQTRIGVVFHLSDVLVLRPWVGFSTLSENNDDYYPNDLYDTKKNNYLNLGSDFLYEMKLADSFLLGLGGQISYSTSTNTKEYPAYDLVKTDTSFRIGALASAQYFFNPVFGIYADVGIGMQKYTVNSDNGTTETGYDETWFGLTTSSLGVVFYVK